MKYRTKEDLIKEIKKQAGEKDNLLDDYFIYNCPTPIACDINEIFDYFGDSMPKTFYKLLWNIIRDAAYFYDAVEESTNE